MTLRPVILSVTETSDELDQMITITLEHEHQRVEGSARSNQPDSTAARLAGEATCRAVEQLVGHDLGLELLAVATTDLGPARIALAQIRDKATGEILIGNALLGRNDPKLAAAKAVMDALNRRLGQLLG